jgi:hypothetical protein
MSDYAKANNFLIAEGEEGEIYIFMDAKRDEPEAPKIIYDGNDHAILLRNNEQKIILDYIHPEVRDRLRKSFQVIVVETILENIKGSYIATMNMVEKIPVDWSKVGLKTWEEAALAV